MTERKTRLDKINRRIRNHPIFAILIVLGTVVVAVSNLTDAAKNLIGNEGSDSDSIQEVESIISGKWRAEVNYDWNDAKYTENFVFNTDGIDIYGTASFLGGNRVISDVKLSEQRIYFITKTREVGGGESRVNIHHYRGKIFNDEIKFKMQTEGGFNLHTEIEFTAKKLASN